jgi:hypothetical protein
MTRARRALVALVLPVLLVGTAACDDGPATPEAAGSSRAPAPAPAATAPPGPGTATTSPAGNRPSASTSAAPADPRHAVDPPGPRRGALSYGDILIYDPDSLSDATISSIRHLPGVVSAEPLAIAQVSIENTVMNLAAVDPATYRNFTPAGSADTQEVWDRVAGGELAIAPRLQHKVPIDDQGYLRLGSDRSAPRVHVGAFADQIAGSIDAVVNESWIPTLRMKPQNALIVSTGQRAPLSLRKPIEQVAGHQASVQMLDIVARAGLDTSVQQTAFLVGSVADAVGTFNYTVLGGGRVAPDPAWVRSHITTQQVPILGNVTCNRLIFPQLTAALTEVQQRGLADKIHPSEYAGCYYPRFIAGTTSLSNHSFGLALDLNTPGNQRGTVGEMDRSVVQIFKKWGFAWGGDWHYTDPMHFEMNALVKPG